MIPVRSPTVHRLDTDELMVIGGCRGKRDHIADVQVYDHAQSAWHLHQTLRLNHARSCHMSAIVGHNLFVLGGWDGLECLDSVEKASLNAQAPAFELLPRRSGLLDRIKNGCCVFDD